MPKSYRMKILCIGNSHTAGFPLYDPLYGGNPKSSYEYWFNILLTRHFSNVSFEINNRGICGQVSSQVRQRLESILSKSHFDIVILWAGANDIAIGYTVNRIWKTLRKAYEFVQETTKVVLVTIPPMNWPAISHVVTELNSKIRKQTNSRSYLVADAFSVLETNGMLDPSYDSGDGVHLSIDGYEKVGKEIFDAVSPLITVILRQKKSSQ